MHNDYIVLSVTLNEDKDQTTNNWTTSRGQKKKTWVNDVQLEVPNIQILVLGNSKKSFKKLFSLFVLAKAG